MSEERDEQTEIREVPPEPGFDEIVKRLGGIAPLALASALLPAVGLFVLATYREPVSAWLTEQGPAGLAIYIAGFSVLAGFALMPTWLQAVVGGFVFGLTSGSLGAVAGCLGAALIGYTVARLVSGNKAERIIHEQPRWAAVHDALLRGSPLKVLGIVTLIRVPPNSPFAMTNLVLAATRVPLWIYALGTAIGIAPRTCAAVYIGSLGRDEKPWWFIWGGVAVAIVVVVVIGVIANHALQRITMVRRTETGLEQP